MVTIIDDREGDIYEKWARLPDRRTHLLTRACRDRTVVGGGTLFTIMAGFTEKHRFKLDLPTRPGKRGAAGLLERGVWAGGNMSSQILLRSRGAG